MDALFKHNLEGTDKHFSVSNKYEMKIVFIIISVLFLFWYLILSMFWQPIVAVPSFICADAFNKLLPFCTGFAAGCMIWMVVAEVLPDAFKVPNFIRQ